MEGTMKRKILKRVGGALKKVGKKIKKGIKKVTGGRYQMPMSKATRERNIKDIAEGKFGFDWPTGKKKKKMAMRRR